MRQMLPAAALWVTVLAISGLPVRAQEPAAVPTFHKDVVPILQKNCQNCHRPGQIAPMSFLSYQETRPWARAMKTAVASRKMPPWFADPAYGHFSNDRMLKQGDIDTISKWADNGAPEGAGADAPPPVQWPDGRLADQTGLHRGRAHLRCAGEGHRRVDVVHRSRRVHRGHVGHLNRGPAQPARGHASRVPVVHPAHTGRAVSPGLLPRPIQRDAEGNEIRTPGGGRGGPPPGNPSTGVPAPGPRAGGPGGPGGGGFHERSRIAAHPQRRHGVDRGMLRAGQAAGRLPALRRGEADSRRAPISPSTCTTRPAASPSPTMCVSASRSPRSRPSGATSP